MSLVHIQENLVRVKLGDLDLKAKTHKRQKGRHRGRVVHGRNLGGKAHQRIGATTMHRLVANTGHNDVTALVVPDRNRLVDVGSRAHDL